MELTRETRWSRHYNDQELQTKFFESKLADGTAAIALDELAAEWPAWDQAARLDFCEALPPARLPHMGDILRFIMKHGNHENWSTIGATIVKTLPIEESVPFLIQACSKCPVGKGANLFKALALSAAPEAVPTLRQCLERTWGDQTLFDEDVVFDWAAYDAVCLIEFLAQLGDRSAGLREKFKLLSQHHNALSRQNAINRLSGFFPG
ncbi:MAG: hypothetical protein AB1705_21090 [Verrucomicrobiota bacterium]